MGSARGEGRGTQAAGTHTQTHNCRDRNDGWRSPAAPPPPPHHPRPFPKQRIGKRPTNYKSCAKGNAPPFRPRAGRGVGGVEVAEGAVTGSWRRRTTKPHQTAPVHKRLHNLPCPGGSQVTWLPCLVCAKRGTMPEGGHPACREREGDRPPKRLGNFCSYFVCP